MDKIYTLNQYKPNILMKVGIILNIIIASALSILIFTIPLTIPIIASSFYLLVPRTQINRHFSIAKIITVLLSAILSLLIIVIINLASNGIVSIWNAIVEFINSIAGAFTSSDVLSPIDSTSSTSLIKAFNVIFSIVTLIGPLLITIGWYDKDELIFIEKSDIAKPKAIKERKKLNKGK